MADPKETKKVKSVDVVRGDMPESDWAKVVADQVKKSVTDLPVVQQLVDAGKAISGLTSLAGAGVRAAQGKGFDPNAPEANAGTVLDAASNLASAGVGAGQQVVGNLINSPEMIAAGKERVTKQMADVTTPIEQRDVPPPPVYPGPEPAAPATETAPTPAQVAPSPAQVAPSPALKAAPRPVIDHAQQGEIDKAYGALKTSAEGAKSALQAQANLASANLEAEDKVARDAELINLQRAQEQARIMEMAQKTRQEWSDRQNRLMDQAAAAAANPIDPNRYWNNKDVGQKVGAVIAGALFGFSGQGMQWLQRLDSLVAQDMRAQESDRASTVRGIEGQAAQAGVAAKEAMAMGADAAEAANLERMAKLQNAKSRIEMLAKSTANAGVRAQAAEMMSQIDGRVAGVAQANQHLQDARTYQRAQIYLEQQKLGIMASKAEQAPAAQLSEDAAKKMANTKELLSTIQQMKSLSSDTGFGDRLARMGAEKLNSEEKGKLDAYNQLRFKASKLIAESALGAEEQKYLLPILGERTGLFSSGPRFDEMTKMALGSMESQLGSALAGRDPRAVAAEIETLKKQYGVSNSATTEGFTGASEVK